MSFTGQWPSWYTDQSGCYQVPIYTTAASTLQSFQLVGVDPVTKPAAPETAVDWLRASVQETCDAAFADIAA